MADEKRSAKRLPGPYDGGWDGEAGLRECRITDLSLGGCFIDAYASSPVGARMTTEIRLAGQLFRLPAEVIYVDRVQGFSVRFLDTEPDVIKALSDAITALGG